MKEIDDIKNKIDAIIRNQGVEPTFLFFLFSNIRVVLEKKNVKQNYPYLNMICNWYQHSKLDKSTIGYEILKNVGDIILDDLQKDKKNWNSLENKDYHSKLVRNISSAFKMNKLKEEVKKFFIEHGINPIIVKNENWTSLLKNILYDLSERPIEFPQMPDTPQQSLNTQQVKAKPYYDYLEKKAKKLKKVEWEIIMPIGFSIHIEEDRCYWKIQMKKLIIIQSPILKS